MNLSVNSFEEFEENTEFLREYIKEVEHLFAEGQDDTELLELVRREYRVTDAELKNILSQLESRKRRETKSKKDIEKASQDLSAFCHVVGIRCYTKSNDGDFIDIEQIRKRLSTRKSQVKKRFEETGLIS